MCRCGTSRGMNIKGAKAEKKCSMSFLVVESGGGISGIRNVKGSVWGSCSAGWKLIVVTGTKEHTQHDSPSPSSRHIRCFSRLSLRHQYEKEVGWQHLCHCHVITNEEYEHISASEFHDILFLSRVYYTLHFLLKKVPKWVVLLFLSLLLAFLKQCSLFIYILNLLLFRV